MPTARCTPAPGTLTASPWLLIPSPKGLLYSWWRPVKVSVQKENAINGFGPSLTSLVCSLTPLCVQHSTACLATRLLSHFILQNFCFILYPIRSIILRPFTIFQCVIWQVWAFSTPLWSHKSHIPLFSPFSGASARFALCIAKWIHGLIIVGSKRGHTHGEVILGLFADIIGQTYLPRGCPRVGFAMQLHFIPRADVCGPRTVL